MYIFVHNNNKYYETCNSWKNLLINRIEDIVSANLTAKCKDDKDCIKLLLSTGTEWTVWSNLKESKEVLRSIPMINKNLKLVRDIEYLVHTSKVGRESNLSKRIKQVLIKD